MEELTIEEKAARYDEAIERARQINSGEGVEAPPEWTTCEVIFPELRTDCDEQHLKDKNTSVIEMPTEDMLRIGALLLNCAHKFINNAYNK